MGIVRLVNTSFFDGSRLSSKVDKLSDAVRQLPQIMVSPKHDIFGGMYARTGLIPAGSTFIGAVHKKDHINIVVGDVTVLTDDGPLRLTGYHVLPTQAGSKRVAHTHADTMWTTIIKTDLTDVEAIEDDVVENSDSLQTRTLKVT